MKKSLLLLGLISLIFAFSAQGQIVIKYQQGFESSGETYGYTVTGGAAQTQTDLYSSGSRALKMSHSGTECTVELDTIDLTDNSSFQYYYLEFMHICTVDPLTCYAPEDVAIVEIKLTNETNWTRLTSDNFYDFSWGGGSSDFVGNSSFSNRSYDAWSGTGQNNTWWKRERFKLENKISGSVPLQNRKIQVRFKLKARTASGTTLAGWYIDNITLKCSPSSMVLPTMKMLAYPDRPEFPSNRGTRVAAEINTNSPLGMCADSIYVLYQLGSAAQITRKPMSLIPGTSNKYQAYIPFCGYDTVVNWRIVAKDNTTNHNAANFPLDESSWQQYASVRGKSVMNTFTTSGNTTDYPFPNFGDFKTQMHYSASELQMLGYSPGAITQIRYTAGSNVSNSQHNRFQIRIANVDEFFDIPSDGKFNNDFQKVVYDSSFTITQNNGTTGIINLQDTFFYAGKGILMTMTYNHGSDPAALRLATVPSANASNTMFGSVIYNGYNASYGFDPFTADLFNYGNTATSRPAFIFRTQSNLPLIYDCGISGFIYPNDSTSANAVGNNNVVVTLKNYGVSPINAVRIWYTVDDANPQYFDWTGNLAGNATTNVTINTTQLFSAGYHEIEAWVDDTVTVGNLKYRDHEPLNDTLRTPFISCDGPMSGVRYIGGSNADYATLENFLYAVSQCGVNGPLTVKLASGQYNQIVFPSIPGTSASNYILFEPANASNNDVIFCPRDIYLATPINSLVNLQATNHIRFNRIRFQSNSNTGAVTYQVRMGTNSTGCRFSNCTFTETLQPVAGSSTYTAASSLLYSGGADSLNVVNCSFVRGTVGINLTGPASDNKAHGNRVEGSSFQNQGINGVVIRNQVAAVVDSNSFDDVYANSSYLILLQDCDGATRVTRNSAYVTSGAACIGATNFYGTATDYAIIANNMLVSADQGTSNMLTTPLNIITASYTKVLYNSLKLIAPSRSGIAAATFGGGVLCNSYFFNNIVACYDSVNFAFNYIPTDTCSNYIGYNIYYSRGPMLNQYDGINCLTLAAWQSHMTTDANSQAVDPGYLNTYNTDLRSYSQNVKNHAVPITEVSDDIFGTARHATTPCVGAFEFSALPYDFEILEFIEPYSDYCDAPTAAPIRVVIKNSGINEYVYAPGSPVLTLTYSRTHTPGVMAPGFSNNVVVTRNVPPTDTIIFNTNATMSFQPNGIEDSTYRLYAWLTYSQDPNPANDTNYTDVTSHFHAPAPTSIATSVNYGNPATITATGGLQTWYSNVYNSGASHQSEVYWYADTLSTTPIYRGSTFTSGLLYSDTTFYIRQKRDYPLVKITEVQIKNNVHGVTYPMPLWMNASTTFAVELTNVGDYPAEMQGDTLMTISSTSGINNKIYVFPNVTIQPGATLVVQFRNINNIDSTVTLGATQISPQYNQNFAVLYRDGTGIVDAVAFNGITTQNQWTNAHVPVSVWAGSGITMNDSTAGVTRKSWPSNASATPSNSQQRWQLADDANRMTLGTTNSNLIRFTDNGCIGDWAPVTVSLINLPSVDISLDSISLPTGCGLGVEPVEVTVRNGGSQPSDSIVLYYSVNGVTMCSDTIAGLPSLGYTTHVFSQPVNLYVPYGEEEKTIKVWAHKQLSDNTTVNDTTGFWLVSAYAPGLPNVVDYDTVNYGGQITLQAITPPADSLAWYDRNMNPLDTTNVFVSDYIYAPDTFYVSAFGTKENIYQVGTLAGLSTATGYPSPYNPNKKYVKEQYLYLASDLIAAGHSAGPVNSIAFYLDTILAPGGTMTFTDYVISIGTTTNATFTSNNNWQAVTPYYSASSLTLTNTTKGWVRHQLNNPFIWDGVSNIVVQITRTINPNLTQGAKTRYTSANNTNRVLYKNDNTNSVVDYSGNGTRSANRPDIQFGFVDYGCEGPAKPVYIAVIGAPNADAGLRWPLGYDTVTFSSCGNINLDVDLRNMGISPIDSCVINYWIDGVAGSYTHTSTVAPNTFATVTFAQPALNPGRHTILAVASLDDDTVSTNDTVYRMINVGFCAGTYTIGPGGLYPTFSDAIDTLNNAGVDGPVIFSVLSGTYNEQISLGALPGVSAVNTVTFTSATNDAADVVLRYAPVNTANYVLNLEGTKFVNFRNMTIYGAATGNGTYSNAVTMSNVSNIHFSRDIIRVKGTINNQNASCITFGDNVRSLFIDSCRIDSGYYSVKSVVTIPDSSYGIYITNDTIVNFWFQGVATRGVNEIYVMDNYIRSGVNINSRNLTGIYIAQLTGGTSIERNQVILYDNRNGAKRGIHLVDVAASNAIRSKVNNNMVAIYGTGAGSSSFRTTGIFIDSSVFANVYFNSVNVYAGTANDAANSAAFWVQTSSNGIHVMNNIFSNISRGYAYYVQNAANIATSNYNAYHSNNETGRFAYWNTTQCSTLTELRQMSFQDVNSLLEPPYFVSNEDLHLSIGTFCEKAQYNTEVRTDIDGTIRPQIPPPCIGAHEFIRSNHDLAIMDIIEPMCGVTDNVESDTLWVIVRLTNGGNSTESNLYWWAEIEGSTPLLRSANRFVDELLPQDVLVDTAFIVMPIGVIDTQTVVVHFPMASDIDPSNNVKSQCLFLDPAYNFRAESVTVQSGDGCRLQQTPVAINLVNVGRKTFPASVPLTITFQAFMQTTGLTVATLPTQWSETAVLPNDVEPLSNVTVNFAQTANLYPTGNAKDIVVRARASVTHPYDQKPMNDTSNYISVTSKYTPSSPEGIDLHTPYGTWDTIFASQTDNPPTGAAIHRNIMWYRDSTAAPFFAPSNYNQSCWWETPQYFDDSTYYLACVSASGCTSYYSSVHVYVNPRVATDAAIEAVEDPTPWMVYMYDDSVKVRIINYGSQPISNIPVVYQLFNPQNQLLQEVREVCPVTIQPDDTYVYRFDSLITIPSWSATQYYKIRAWTDLTNDAVHSNDTLRGIYNGGVTNGTNHTPVSNGYVFQAIPEYAIDNTPNNRMTGYHTPTVENYAGLDITRVSFSSLNQTFSPVGNNYIDMASIANPDAPVLRMIKGTTDTLIVSVANTDNCNDTATFGFLTLCIDLNRDGVFDNPYQSTHDDDPYSEVIFKDTVFANHSTKHVMTIPSDIRTGYMRMRLIMQQGVFVSVENPDYPSFEFGQVQDYLLYIEDQPDDVDLCAAHIVAPLTNLLDSARHTVSFMVANKGAMAVTSAQVTYDYYNSESGSEANHGTFQWTGNVDPGNSVQMELPEYNFPVGTTDLRIIVEAVGDTLTHNDTLWYQYHRFEVITLYYNEYFEGEDIWYAPRGYNEYDKNLWQRGHIAKPNIMACVSDSNVWATNLTGFVNNTRRGNVSILYSPIINISQIRADTISLWVAMDMGETENLTIEYYDYRGRWITMGTGNDTMWYNTGNGWSGVSSGYGYTRYVYSTTGSGTATNFQQRLQFRLVYHANVGSLPNDGCAFDDFKIGRQQRNIDVGVIAITHPTHPQFGQTINPTVIIKNYGYDTIYSANLAYMPYGSYLAKTGTYENPNGLCPGATDSYTFSSPFIVRNDFPDTFQISAYTTVNTDIYKDNDSVTKDFYLSPLDNDMAMVGFIYPLDRIVAGDSITITTRLRNYGQAPVNSTNVTFIFNNNYEVTETVDFNALLGRPLGSFEFFNYTFNHRCRASMGLMYLTAFVHMDNDDYIYNDTISKSIDGLSAITDLKAREVIVDTSGQLQWYVQLTVDNIGARSANNFEVGFWYYNDTNTIVRDTFRAEYPLPALSTLYFRFDTAFAPHSEHFRYVTAFVNAIDDNDRSNDTTTVIARQYTDLTPVRILVEENREEDCHVRLEVANNGNMPNTRNINIKATINGTSIRTNQLTVQVSPGQTRILNFTAKIPKSPTRTYVGTASLTCQDDRDTSNNQTTIVEVQNYFEGVPVVEGTDGMKLEQNYPNPFNNTTRIDFYLPTAGQVRFFVIDEMGRMVYHKEGFYGQGNNTIDFGESGLSTGVYYYGIEMNGERQMRKMVFKR